MSNGRRGLTTRQGLKGPGEVMRPPPSTAGKLGGIENLGTTSEHVAVEHVRTQRFALEMRPAIAAVGAW
jgi:hypothetical protein